MNYFKCKVLIISVFLITFVIIRSLKNMVRISFTEFENNLERYIDLANTEKVIISQEKGMSFTITPIKNEDEANYSDKFVHEILQVNEEAEPGYVTRIEDPNDIWESVL